MENFTAFASVLHAHAGHDAAFVFNNVIVSRNGHCTARGVGTHSTRAAFVFFFM